MHKSQKLIFPMVVVFTATLLSACSAPEGDVTRGKRWYTLHNCSACHGDTGREGDAVSISPLDMSYNAFKKRLRTKGSQIMPYFSEQKLNNEDAADIYAFLKNMK